MFFTRDDAEIALGARVCEGFKGWRFVEWNMNVPWFWVTVMVKEEHYRTTNTLMLFMPGDIADLVTQNPATEIKSVQLVTPPQMNHTNDWRMESLAAIVSGIERNTRNPIHIYKCASGITYIDSGIEESIPALLEEKIIYSAAV